MKVLLTIGNLIGCGLLLAQVAALQPPGLQEYKEKDPYLGVAVDMIEYGQYREAIKYLKKNPNASSKSYGTFYLLGISYKMLGDFKNATFYLRKASFDQYSSLNAHFELGNCYLKQALYAPAIEHFNRCIGIDSTFLAAYNNRAYARIRRYGTDVFPQDQLEMARRDLYKVLSSSAQGVAVSDVGKYYFNLGMVEMYLGNYLTATKHIESAVEISPGDGKYYYYLGASRFLNRDYLRAADAFLQSEALGYQHANTEEFLRIIDLVRSYWSENE